MNEIQSPGTAEDSTLARVRKARKEADDSGQSTWRKEAQECYSFTAGDQWDPAVKAQLLEENRPPVTFNRIGPMVDSVAGSEVNNRQQVQYIPRTIGDKGVNEVLTGAADYVRDNCDAEDEESDAFLDAVICGIGVTETRLDYEEDPEGAVLVERRDPLAMRWDPGAKKRNLMDRRWQQYDAYLSKEDILAKWPDAEIIGGQGDAESKTHDDTRAAWYEDNQGGDAVRAGKLCVTHHQWFETESFVQALNTLTGKIEDIETAELPKFQERFKAITGAEAQTVKKTRRKYMQAFTCGATVLEEGPVECNRFTFHFITGKRDRNKNVWYGIVKAMLDPQRWANKFLSQTIHIINTNAKGGLLVEEDAVDNMTKFKADWPKAEGVVTVNSGALSGGKVMPKPPPTIPPQIESLLQFSISSLRDVTGINLELLGMADRQQAGVVEAQRKQAAMTVLATLFDGLRRYRKEQGRTLAKFITEYLSDGRLVRIVGGDGTERYVPLIRDPQVRYDIVVDEAPASVNQKERTFAMLMQMLPNLSQMGVPFAPELLDYTPLPAAMVEKWKQVLQQGQMDPRMIQQLQQANQQLQQQLQQANMALKNKQDEIAARLQEAEMKSNADLVASLRKVEEEARADYAAAVRKAELDAEATVRKAFIDANAKVQAQQVISANQPQPQATVVQLPEYKMGKDEAARVEAAEGGISELMQMVQQMAQHFTESQAAIGPMMEEMRANIAKASRKPKRFEHERDPKTGGIVRSVPVFD